MSPIHRYISFQKNSMNSGRKLILILTKIIDILNFHQMNVKSLNSRYMELGYEMLKLI
jgi:hypothetical protein